MVLALYLQAHPLKENRRTQLRGIFTCLSTLHRSLQVAVEFFPHGRKDSSLTGDHRNYSAHCLPTTDAVGRTYFPTSLPILSLNNSSIDPLTQFLVPVQPRIYCLKIN
ncbi:hypothetical protein AMECASPLE_021447 [Ameca splendens]|uniref:Uncharacterized protein n=1 Tax=Ameca splendens TaxID=208324 RepID=A0ABV0Y3M4_9TELE